MLKLIDIGKSYIKGKSVLKNISVEFQQTGFISILGKSGSGKSTLLNIIGGLDSYDQGELIINNKSTKEYSRYEWDAYRNTYIGFVFQEFNNINRLTVSENIELALKLQKINKREIKNRVKHILELVELQEYHDRKISNLSGGEKQRVAIARALVKNPKIIIADEPTGNLDSETSKVILEILKRLSKDKLIIMVTHDEEFANAYGDRIIQLKDGEIISDKTKIGIKESIEYEKNLELKRSALPLDTIYNFALNSLFYKKINLFFMVILLACSIMFVTIATSYNFYDVSEATIKTFNKTNIDIIPMNKYTDDNDSHENLVSFTNEDFDHFIENYKSIKFVKSYFKPEFPFIIMDNYIPKSPYDSNKFNKVAILNDKNMNLYSLKFGNYPNNIDDVLITDYMANMLLKYDVFEGLKNENDLLGHDLINNSIKLTICGIVDTDYEIYYQKLIQNDLSDAASFSVEKDNTYMQLFMTQQTYDEKLNIDADINGIPILPFTEQYNDRLIGKLPKQGNELVISLNYLGRYLGEYIYIPELSVQDIETYLGSKINLDLSTYGMGETEFEIVGILNDYLHPTGKTFMFTRDMYLYFDENPTSHNKIKYVTLTAFLGSNNKENNKFITSFSDTSIKHNTIYSRDLYEVSKVKNQASTIIYYIAIVFALFASIMMFTFITSSIKAKQKEIGILRALGARGIDVMKIYLTESLLIILISNFLGLGLSILVLRWQNSNIIETFNVNIQVLYINYFCIFLAISLSIIITTISTFIPLLNITLMTPSKSIRTSK